MRASLNHSQEAERLEELRSYEILGTPEEVAFDRITSQLARLLRMPVALVTFVEEDRQWFKSHYGTERTGSARAVALCNDTIAGSEVLIVPDTLLDSRFRENSFVLGEPRVRFYAGAPLRNPQGHNLGALCVMDFEPRELSAEERGLLVDFSHLVMDELELRRTARRLREEVAERESTERRLQEVVQSMERRVQERTNALLASHSALQEAEERYRGIFENSVDGMFQSTPEGRYLEVNPSLARLYGYTTPAQLIEELRDIGQQLYVKDNRRAEFLAEMQTVGSVSAFESQIRRRDGSTLWISETARAVRDERGHVIRFEGIVKDIARRKSAEEALHQAYEEMEERVRARTAELEQFNRDLQVALRENSAFSAALRCSVVGMLITDPSQPDNPAVYANPAFEKITGYSPEEVIGHNCRFLQGEQTAPEMVAAMREAIRERRPFRGLLLNYRKDGTPFWNELAVDPVFDEAGQLIHFVGLQNDVTERVEAQRALRQSEARKAAILDSSLDAVITIDHLGRILEINPATEQIFGYTAEQMLGQIMSDLIVPPAYRQAHNGGMHSYMKTGVGPALGQRLELPAMRADGTEFPIELAINRIVAEGAPMFTGHIRDITTRKKSEEALRVAKEEAERANTAKSDFLSRMSHELRTPLNAILGFSQLMQRRAMEPKQAESVGYIAKAGRHLLDLVNEVLDLARIEAGHTTWSPECVSVLEVLAESIDLLRPQTQERSIDIVIAGATSEAWFVTADRQRLKQIFLNLLTNGVKYNRECGRVIVRCAPAEDGLMAVEFADTGLGISPEKLSRLFVPFERLGAEQSGIEGTGIGLALTQRLILMMGGQIEVQSEQGEGSTFRVLLPRALQTPQAELPPLLLDETRRSTTCQHTVLYVEDHPANIRLMEHVVAEHGGIQLVTCTQGTQAVVLARKFRPHLILLDLHLPDLPGDQVLPRLLAEPELRNTPVVMVSADAMSKQIPRLLEAGAAGYVTKPIEISSMLQTLEQFLGTAVC